MEVIGILIAILCWVFLLVMSGAISLAKDTLSQDDRPRSLSPSEKAIRFGYLGVICIGVLLALVARLKHTDGTPPYRGYRGGVVETPFGAIKDVKIDWLWVVPGEVAMLLAKNPAVAKPFW